MFFTKNGLELSHSSTTHCEQVHTALLEHKWGFLDITGEQSCSKRPSPKGSLPTTVVGSVWYGAYWPPALPLPLSTTFLCSFLRALQGQLADVQPFAPCSDCYHSSPIPQGKFFCNRELTWHDFRGLGWQQLSRADLWHQLGGNQNTSGFSWQSNPF